MERKHLYQIPQSIAHPPYLRWYIDPKLRRYIDRRIPPDYSPAQILEILKRSISEVQQLSLERKDYTLADRNLSDSMTAFLAYILFAQRKTIRLNSFVEILERYFPGTELADLYQISLVVISQPTKFLQNFDVQASGDWHSNLSRYSHNKFPKCLIDELRRLAGDKFKRTNLGILARTTCPQIRQKAKQPDRDRLLLLHQCFQSAVIAGEFSTKNPQPADYDSLLALYRDRKQDLDLDIVDREEVQQLLTNLSNIVRNYYQPTSGALSLDTPIGDDDSSQTIGDLQIDLNQSIDLDDRHKRDLALDLLSKNSLVGVLSAKRRLRQQLRNAKGKASAQAEATPTPTAQVASPVENRLFLFRYGLGLTQSEIGIELDCNQSTSGRQHDRTIAKLAKELYLSYENKPSTTQLSIETLDEYIEYLKLVCEDYYTDLVMNILTETIQTSRQASIVEQFVEQLETNWQFRFKPDCGGLNKVYTFVQRRSIRSN
jgi:hypothetical protein